MPLSVGEHLGHLGLKKKLAAVLKLDGSLVGGEWVLQVVLNALI